MKMFLTAFPVFLLCLIARGIQCIYLLESESVNNTLDGNCPDWQTECLFGCCPLKDAVCCADGFECCPKGKTCIPFIGLCIGTENNDGQVSLTSEQATVLMSSVFTCPPGMTECAPNRCCPYKQGVCCQDGEHCCPNGYTCDYNSTLCIPINGVSRFEKPLLKTSAKSPYISCPGGRRMCPAYMSCCVKDNGDWSCCPNPSLPQIEYGNGQCCDTIFGSSTCCPNDSPVCSLFGCRK